MTIIDRRNDTRTTAHAGDYIIHSDGRLFKVDANGLEHFIAAAAVTDEALMKIREEEEMGKKPFYTGDGLLAQIRKENPIAFDEALFGKFVPEYKIPKCETFRDANGNLCKRYIPEPFDYPKMFATPNILNPFRSFYIGLDPAAPDNTEIRIIVKKRNIKFNFKN
ncbi:MAG: hypothetical protein IJ588_13745 [Prevotella sp.]|nr:hypothetical protein [Prevotella sp.]